MTCLLLISTCLIDNFNDLYSHVCSSLYGVELFNLNSFYVLDLHIQRIEKLKVVHSENV